MDNSLAAPLIRKLEADTPLTETERQALLALPVKRVRLAADQDILREGDRPSRACILLSGYACSYKLSGEGRRQVLAFHIPGEIPDAQSLHLKKMDNSLATQILLPPAGRRRCRPRP